MRSQIEQVKRKLDCKVDRMFSNIYFGREVVEKLRLKGQRLDQTINTQTQERFFIAVVQATMTGKTRLLLELIRTSSKPVIMMRLLTKHNFAYKDLLQSIEDNNAKKDLLPYEERRDHNKRILLKIRLFFYGYMVFLKEFLLALNKNSWKDLSQTEIDVFNGMLLNGGTTVLRDIFARLLELTAIDRTAGQGLRSAKTHLAEKHQQLAEELGTPWFVLDECHTPQFYCQGFLFHSDYKGKGKEVIYWQQYEMLIEEARVPPPNYSYVARTTLFSGFQWVVIEFLQQACPQLTIFTSTYFSAWEPSLLDTQEVTHNRPYVERFYDLYSLTIDDVVATVCSHFKDYFDANQKTKELIAEMLSDWTGRPGFLFEYFIPCLEEQLTGNGNRDLKTILVHAERKARAQVQSFIRQNMKEQANIARPFEILGDGADTKGLVQLLHYTLILRNGNLSGTPGQICHMVQAGFARVTCYEETSSSVVIDEPLVRGALAVSDTEAATMNAEKQLCKVYASKLDELAEYAIALQIVRHNGQTLRELLSDGWCSGVGLATLLPDKKSREMLLQLKVNAHVAGRLGDFGIDNASELLLWKNLSQGRVILARTGLKLPDILFTATGHNILCLCSIQVKVMKKRLSPSEFTEALESVTRTHFLRGSPQPLPDDIQNNWKLAMEANKATRICHLRIVITWKGFTRGQLSAAAEFSKSNPEQPILLVYPRTTLVGRAIYGSRCHRVLSLCLSEPNSNTTRTPQSLALTISE